MNEPTPEDLALVGAILGENVEIPDFRTLTPKQVIEEYAIEPGAAKVLIDELLATTERVLERGGMCNGDILLVLALIADSIATGAMTARAHSGVLKARNEGVALDTLTVLRKLVKCDSCRSSVLTTMLVANLSRSLEMTSLALANEREKGGAG